MNAKTDAPRPIARVSAPLCNGCGICREVCEAGAVRIGNVARIDAEKCTGCGTCAERCPTGAIVMVGKRRTKGRNDPADS